MTTSRSWFGCTLARAMVPLFMAFTCLTGAACKSAGQVRVEDEDSVAHRTGQPEYDEFFDDVYELKQQLKSVSDDEKRARSQLGELMGASDPMDELLRRTQARIEQFSQSKRSVRFEVDGLDEQGRPLAGKPVTIKPVSRGRAHKDAAEFASVLEATAKSEAQIWEKFSPLADRAHRLDNKADALVEHLDSNFPSARKRDEVKRNLVGAKGLLAELGNQTDKAVSASTKFLKGTSEVLAQAVTTGKDKSKSAKEKDRQPVAKSAKSTASEPARTPPAAVARSSGGASESKSARGGGATSTEPGSHAESSAPEPKPEHAPAAAVPPVTPAPAAAFNP